MGRFRIEVDQDGTVTQVQYSQQDEIDADAAAVAQLQIDAAAAAEQTRQDTFRNAADTIDILNRLRTATGPQIDTFIDNNVTSIATARTFLKALTKIVALIAKS